MGGLAGFPSAPMTVWCGLRGWDTARQRGVYQPFILPMQMLTFGMLAVLAPSGGTGPGFGAAALFVVPASVVGTACGRAVTWMLLLAGLAMVAR
jgi:uncharacterized protein